MIIQKYVILGMMVASIIAFIVMRCYLYSTQIYVDNFLTTPRDYSIMLRGIPKNAT